MLLASAFLRPTIVLAVEAHGGWTKMSELPKDAETATCGAADANVGLYAAVGVLGAVALFALVTAYIAYNFKKNKKANVSATKGGVEVASNTANSAA